jgi:hypothetical protein
MIGPKQAWRHQMLSESHNHFSAENNDEDSIHCWPPR